MRVVEILAESGESATLKEVALRVDLVKSSAFRILYSLKELGYVEHAAGKGAYRLTWKTLGLARRSIARATLANVARTQLTWARDQIWESVWLAEWRQNGAILVDVVEAPQRLQLSLDVGSQCPLHATAAGKAIAAHLPAKVLNTFLGRKKLPRFTERTITERGRLQEELQKVRSRGYAVNQEETILGAILVGAPIFDASGTVCGAVSISLPTARSSGEKYKAMTECAVKAAKAITEDLGNLGFHSARKTLPVG